MRKPRLGALGALTVVCKRLRYLLGSMVKPRSVVIPEVPVTYRELPGTRVGFWVVSSCPYCAQTHFHSAGTGNDDPVERLGEVEARCAQGRYVIGLPPRPRSKKERKAATKRGRKFGAISEEWEE